MDGQTKTTTRSFSLSRKISRKVKPTTKKALPDEKISIYDDCEVKSNEHSWVIKMKSTATGAKKVERILVAGPVGLRLLIPDTYEEVGKFPYRKMREFSHNESYKLFQFTWFPSEKEEETFYFHTSKCKEIQGIISTYIKNILKQQNVDNPEAVLQQCTYQRPPQIDRIKTGGRQRSYSTDDRRGQKIKKRNPPVTGDEKPKLKLASYPEMRKKSEVLKEESDEHESSVSEASKS